MEMRLFSDLCAKVLKRDTQYIHSIYSVATSRLQKGYKWEKKKLMQRYIAVTLIFVSLFCNPLLATLYISYIKYIFDTS